jgi:hypothetical protein
VVKNLLQLLRPLENRPISTVAFEPSDERMRGRI